MAGLVIRLLTILAWSVGSPVAASPVDGVDSREIAAIVAQSTTSAEVVRADAIVSRAMESQPSPRRITRIFLSTSLPSGDIRHAIDVARRDPDTILVFRGLPPGHSLRTFHGVLASRSDSRTLPPIHLDPPAFRDAGITEVPVVVVYAGAKPIGSVAGLIDPTWLREQLDAGEQGRWAPRGPVVSIIEPDLMAQMQARFRTIDWTGWRARQRDGLVHAMLPAPLPVARASQVRYRDPTFTLRSNVQHGGQFLARAGDRVNPLERVPFQQTVIAFDATDTVQLALAKSWIEATTARVTVMTTAVPEDDSSAFLVRTSTHLGVPVLMFREDLGRALGIERVPSRVVAEAGRFRIEEVAPGVAP